MSRKGLIVSAGCMVALALLWAGLLNLTHRQSASLTGDQRRSNQFLAGGLPNRYAMELPHGAPLLGGQALVLVRTNSWSVRFFAGSPGTHFAAFDPKDPTSAIAFSQSPSGEGSITGAKLPGSMKVALNSLMQPRYLLP